MSLFGSASAKCRCSASPRSSVVIRVRLAFWSSTLTFHPLYLTTLDNWWRANLELHCSWLFRAHILILSACGSIETRSKQMKGSIAAAETYKSSPLSLIVHTEAHKSFPRFSQASLALSAPKQSISRSNKTNYHIDNTNPFLIPKTSDSQSNSSQFCRCCDGNKSLCAGMFSGSLFSGNEPLDSSTWFWVKLCYYLTRQETAGISHIGARDKTARVARDGRKYGSAS